jgi:putative ABC transport system substrate-binding protein
MGAELASKRLGLLHDLLPQARRIAALVNRSAASELTIKTLEAPASRIGVEIESFPASTSVEIDMAFAKIVQKRADALISGAGPPFNERRPQIVTLAARYAVPAIYPAREAAEIGGLMSYSPSDDRFRQVGIYAGRILKGEKPADLPVMLPTKFAFVINLQTARLLGLTVPPTLLAIADQVIE